MEKDCCKCCDEKECKPCQGCQCCCCCCKVYEEGKDCPCTAEKPCK